MLDKIFNFNKKTINILNNQKGISLIMLIIAIIMMLIIVTFAVFNSQNTTPEAKFARELYSLKSVKEACENALTLVESNLNEYDEYYFFGNNIHNRLTTSGVVLTEAEKANIAKECGLDETYVFNEDTYMIKPAETEEEKRVNENLEIKGLSSTYIVDLKNSKYYILGGIEHASGDTVYEYRDILLSYEMLTATN